MDKRWVERHLGFSWNFSLTGHRKWWFTILIYGKPGKSWRTERRRFGPVYVMAHRNDFGGTWLDFFSTQRRTTSG